MKGYDFMKNIKRFMSIITVAVMVFCLNAFTVSAETFSITVNNTNTDSVSINGKTFTCLLYTSDAADE